MRFEREGRRIRRFRVDNGGEYISKAFQTFLEDEGIAHEPTVPGNPQMAGTSERLGQTLMAKTHPMILSSGLDKDMWPEVVRTANYLTIRSPVTKLGKTPYET